MHVCIILSCLLNFLFSCFLSGFLTFLLSYFPAFLLSFSLPGGSTSSLLVIFRGFWFSQCPKRWNTEESKNKWFEKFFYVVYFYLDLNNILTGFTALSNEENIFHLLTRRRRRRRRRGYLMKKVRRRRDENKIPHVDVPSTVSTSWKSFVIMWLLMCRISSSWSVPFFFLLFSSASNFRSLYFSSLEFSPP